MEPLLSNVQVMPSLPCKDLGAKINWVFSKSNKETVGDIRDVGSIPGLGRSPEKGHGNPL